ncbi:MAG: glycosyltransferase [Lachnospiraceae bacterium]|nr:glycosyltransferase [Lachnospiraceae bacterium]
MTGILLVWECFGCADILEAFRQEGHTIREVNTTQEELLSGDMSLLLDELLQTCDPDFVFSFNYFPNLAIYCKEKGIPYLSWTYDSPYIHLYSYTLIYPTNRVFVFDSDTYLKFHSQGIDTVRFLPMAANPKRLMKLKALFENNKNIPAKNGITFIGSLYDTEHDFYGRMKGLSAYTEGFLRGLMESQKCLYGQDIVEPALTKEVLEDMHKVLPLEPKSDTVATMEYLFAQYVLHRRITAEERRAFLEILGKGFPVDVYTSLPAKELAGCRLHNPVDFYEEAPKVYAASAINLNISLRSIVNGIPLRCFEILGSGGFLLTDYRGDMELFFEEGRDYASFSDQGELIQKVRYYLAHEEERRAMAESAHRKISEAHTYRHRVREMLDSL